MSEGDFASVNQLLAALPESQFQSLFPHLEQVILSPGQVLYEPGQPIREVYFPSLGTIISFGVMLADGSTSEIGLIGREGVLGFSVFLGSYPTTSLAIVRIEGTAMRIGAEVLKREFQRGGALQKRLLLYTQALLSQVSQTVICNRQHSLTQRFARWLLLLDDLTERREIAITEEFIADLLGVPVLRVMEIATPWQEAGVISGDNGRVKILNREELEVQVCECYGLVQEEYLRLLRSIRIL